MINLLSKTLAKTKKEHGIVYPSNFVHISTLPLQLAKLNQKEKHGDFSISSCMDKNKNKVDDPGAYCASIQDKISGNTKWRSNPSKEAIASASHTAVLRDQKKECAISEYSPRNFKRIREATKSGAFKNNVYEAILIEEGLGNFKDRFFYTKECLQNAAETGLFNGAQSFADHPSEDEEIVRPERSTRDILGYYENVRYEENEEGRGQLIASLSVANIASLDWANALLTNSLEYATKFKEKDLVGLSINAHGSADPMDIDQFMASTELADSVKAKLIEAKGQGVTQINLVNALTEAQSVDLVTKAGAGGRVLKMLEKEKSMGKRTVRESEAHETHHEDGDVNPGKGKPDGASPDHADADQDKALFAKMIKQYLGKDDASPEEMEAAKHAYEAHKEAGMEAHEAYEAAGKHLKMAMAIGKKMAQAHETHESEAHETHESEAHENEESECNDKKEAEKNKEKKESYRVAQLAGEVAKMRESIRRYELRDYLDAKLKACGESNGVTKKFREALGVPMSKKHIDDTWNVFMKAFKAGQEEVDAGTDAFFVEKNSRRETISNDGSSFEGCLR